MDLKKLSQHANAGQRARQRMQRSGVNMSGHKLWTPQEDEVITSLYPDYGAITKALPHRTYFTCRSRARKLGIVKQRKHFTAKELSIVRRHYPTATHEELLALLPGRNWAAIKYLARTHHIYRELKPFKETGVPVIDQIRERCRELNYKMPDLDKLVRTKSYFAKGSWHNGHIHHRAIGRAVKVLFGDLKADWK